MTPHRGASPTGKPPGSGDDRRSAGRAGGNPVDPSGAPGRAAGGTRGQRSFRPSMFPSGIPCYYIINEARCQGFGGIFAFAGRKNARGRVGPERNGRRITDRPGRALTARSACGKAKGSDPSGKAGSAVHAAAASDAGLGGCGQNAAECFPARTDLHKLHKNRPVSRKKYIDKNPSFVYNGNRKSACLCENRRKR